MTTNRDEIWRVVIDGLIDLEDDSRSEPERLRLDAMARLVFAEWRREQRIDGAYSKAIEEIEKRL